MNLEILPLAITMMVGPAIMASIIFVTHEQVVRVSIAYLLGVTIGTVLGVAVAMGLARLLGDTVSLGDSSERGSAGTIIQIALVALLALSAVKNYVNRETVKPPKWLGAMLGADARKALGAGILVILLGPSDILVMLTVGLNLEHNGSSLIEALPFIALTVLIAALPLLAFLLFRRRASVVMPKVRDWMNSHSWVVNIAMSILFILLILA